MRRYFTNNVLTKTYHSEAPTEWDTAIEYVKIEADTARLEAACTYSDD